MHLAHVAKKTRVDHGNIYGMYASILKMNVMTMDRMFFPLDFT
jgi:hypothetical protein